MTESGISNTPWTPRLPPRIGRPSPGISNSSLISSELGPRLISQQLLESVKTPSKKISLWGAVQLQRQMPVFFSPIAWQCQKAGVVRTACTMRRCRQRAGSQWETVEGHAAPLPMTKLYRKMTLFAYKGKRGLVGIGKEKGNVSNF